MLKKANGYFPLICTITSAVITFFLIMHRMDDDEEFRFLHNRNMKLMEEVNDVRVNNNYLQQANEKLIQALIILEENSNRIESKLDVLDGAVHPDQKRQQRLMKTRDVIIKHLNKGISIPSCGTLDPWQIYRIAGWIVDYTDRYGVDISLALAIAKRESRFCQKAVSKAGAVGIMQLMPSTATDLSQRIGVSLNKYSTEDNIRMGVYYLAQLLLDFKGNTELAVKSYNAGPNHVKRVVAGEISEYYKETREYWEFVSQYKEEFKKEGL